jgi:1-acyl-sn-glycerol-3-phosphate acyltransferase/DNA-directed RNA polymerase subunit RPC12/RpoP
MKIKIKKLPLSSVLEIPKQKHKKPKRPSFLLRTVIRVISIPDLWKVRFKLRKVRMDKIKKEPCLILMNHSSFIDLKIASKIFYPKPYSIVCTSDGFIGKELLMRYIGCIPTKKFVRDLRLISDIQYALKELKVSVLMYPEASYSFDGRATALPRRLGNLIKKLSVPVVMVKTEGAFALDPLYNGLRQRKVNVSAEANCILTKEEIAELSADEIDKILDDAFSFDNFRWQQENKIEINEPFRAEGLERILYKCPNCKSEGKTKGEGIHLTCSECGKKYLLDSFGYIKALEGETEFSHIPDWYDWERNEVKKEILNGSYRLEDDVRIFTMADYKAIYDIGEGHLIHNENGFSLKGFENSLDYTQSPLASYSLYADYYWYEVGDVICIGNGDKLYYCFPKSSIPVAKARLAAEELYKLRDTHTQKA